MNMQGSAESVGEVHYPPKYQLAAHGLNRGQNPAPATTSAIWQGEHDNGL